MGATTRTLQRPTQHRNANHRDSAATTSGRRGTRWCAISFVMGKRTSQCLALALIFSALLPCASAHDPGLSSTSVTLGSASIQVVATFSSVELQALTAGTDSSPEALLVEAIQFVANDETLEPASSSATSDAANNVQFDFEFAAPGATQLTIRSPLVNRLSFGHRQLLTVRDSAGNPIRVILLKAGSDSVDIETESPAGTSTDSAKAVRTPSFGGFVVLGFEHILIGFDHILFLIALLIVVRSYGDALRIITCFTIAHSITLALATFQIVTLPNRAVEAVIASSIIYVAVENLVRRGEPRGRYLLTVAFGLVHGMGFASVLQSLGIGASTSGAILPLLSFNVGVELGQITLAAITLPLLLRMRNIATWTKWGIPAASAAIALAGAAWLLDRVA